MANFTSSKFFIFLLILVLIGVVAATTKESYRRYQINKKVAEFKKQVELLKEENQTLSNLIDYFSSEQSLEKEARIKLNLLKEGEKLIIIGSEKGTDSRNQSLEDIKKTEDSNFEKWWEWLGFDRKSKN